jgi:VWFA-related protein
MAVASGPTQQISYEAQFEVAVDLVTVQVRVVGQDEEFLSGLTADDFALLIDGEERPITVLYEVNLPPISDDAGGGDGALLEIETSPSAVTTTVVPRPSQGDRDLPPAARRHILLFLDFFNASRVGVLKAQAAAQRFLDTYVRRDDMLGVAAYSPVTGLELLVPFTGHHELANRAVESFFSGRAAERMEPQFQDIGLQELMAFENAMSEWMSDLPGTPTIAEVLESSQAEQYAGATASYLDSLTELGETLAAVQGRKHVVFFSRGFSDQVWAQNEGTSMGGTEQRESEVRDAAQEAAEALQNADAAIHTFHPDNLPVSNVRDISQMKGGAVLAPGQLNRSVGVMNDRQFLNFIAEETGGVSSWYAYNLEEGLAEVDEVDEVSRSYYVLGYQRRADDPEVVSVDVSCTFPAAAVVAAPTQLANVPAFEQLTLLQRQLQLAEALELGVDANRMSMELQVLPLGTSGEMGRFAVLVQVPMREAQRLAHLRNDGILQFEILGVVLDEGGRVTDFFRNGIRLNATLIHEAPPGYDMPFRYYNLLLMPPGRYQAKVIVREASVGQLSSRSLSLQVPAAGALVPNVLGPLRVAPYQSSYLARGIDPASPPDNRKGLPLEFPFQVNGVELTPDISPLMQAGESYEIWVSIRGISGDLGTFGLSAGMEFDLVDASGSLCEIEYFETLDEELDTETQRLNLHLRMSLPDDLAVGPHSLRLRFTDSMTGETTESSLPINIVGR